MTAGSAVTTFGWDTDHGWRTSARTGTGTPVTYTYTGTGRLASFADPQRDVEATYDYDAAGQRTASYVREGSLATTTTYTYEGLSLLALAAVRSDSTTASVAYLYDGAGRAYAGVYAATDVTATPFVLVSSDRGDVLSLADTDGATFAAYRYDAWGAVLETTVTATPGVPAALAQAIADTQPLRYAGYCYDGHSGLYYLSARSYDPVTRQFLTKDPARADGEESAYQYCGGDPVGGVDPSGMWRAFMHGRWLGKASQLAGVNWTLVCELMQGAMDADAELGILKFGRWWRFNAVFRADIHFNGLGNLRKALDHAQGDYGSWRAYLNDVSFAYDWASDTRCAFAASTGREAKYLWEKSNRYTPGNADRRNLRRAAAWWLGLGAHAIQDVFAHGDLTPAGHKVKYPESDIWLDGKADGTVSWKPERKQPAIDTSMKYLRSFAYFSQMSSTP